MLKLAGLRMLSLGLLFLSVAACSGGDNGGGGTMPVASPSVGVFIDSPVQGLGYSCAPSGLSGLTDVNGQYNFLAGDTVTFTLYGRPIGAAVPAGPVVTGLSVFTATSLSDPRVINLAQLLLTLAGGSPAAGNPIVVPPTPPAGFPATLDFSMPGFDTSFPGLTLVSETTATTHLSASFKTLAVTLVNSGSVTSNPAGINCTTGTCVAVFQTGTVVTLTATGTGFTGWSGGTGSASCAGIGTCVVMLNVDSTVTATFPVAPPPATVAILPNGGTGAGSVTCSANGGAFGACAASYPNPTPLVMRATANSGSTFIGWTDGTGNAVSCNGTTVDCSMTLTANSAIRANFTLPVQNSVTAATATANGGGGTVTCSANGGAAGSCGSYPVGSSIMMTPIANSVSNFTGWSGGTGSTAACNGTTGTCNFTLTANTNITANFNRPTLTVTISGTGSVSSSPSGINNCTSNCTASFDRGTSVTLTAGAGLTGWSGGGCSGTGPCVVTLNADTTVTATFGAGATSLRYHFIWAPGGTSPLLAIHPASPTTVPATVASTSGIAQSILTAASYDGAAQTFSALRSDAVVYTSSGRLFRVDARTSAGAPGGVTNPPTQVSNETGLPPFGCDGTVLQNPLGPSIVMYELPGLDGDCLASNDNVLKYVSLSAAATVPPGVFPPGLRINGAGSAVYNFATGQASHAFLLDEVNANALKIVNLTTFVVTTIQANVGYIEIVAQDTSDRVFLMSAGFGPVNTRTLYVYTISTNTLTPLLTGTSDLLCGGDTCSDGANLFIAEVAGKLYRVPLSATSSANVTTILNGATPIQEVALTANRVFLVTDVGMPGSTSNGLISLPKAGGATTPHVPPGGDSIVRLFTTNNAVFFSRFLANTATIIAEDGAAIAGPLPGRWLGSLRSPSFSLRAQSTPIVKMALLNGPISAGTPVLVYDATSPTGISPVAMGGLPTTISPINLNLLGVNSFSGFLDNTMLGVAPLTAASHSAVFFMDTTIPNSLVLVPTPTGSWIPDLF